MEHNLIKRLDDLMGEWQIARDGEVLPTKIRISPYDKNDIFRSLIEETAQRMDLPKTWRGIPIEVDNSLQEGQIEFDGPKDRRPPEQ